MRCPHCGGNILGDQCLQCARPAKTYPAYYILSSPGHKTRRRGQCSNCERSDLYLTTGLCGTCYSVIRGIKKNTPLWRKRLAEVKNRIKNHRFLKNLTKEEKQRRAKARKIKCCRICCRQITVIQDGLCNYCNREAVRQLETGHSRRSQKSECALQAHAEKLFAKKKWLW